MVIDTIVHGGLYHFLGPRFGAGLKWLQAFEPALPDGRYDIEGDDLFALVQSYDTVPASDKKYESHRLYADIQYVATGTETIYYSPVDCLQAVTPYDGAKDILLYANPAAATPLHLPPGSFAIFHPQDGHKPGCVSGKTCQIKKVVIKVRT
jgi:biofilm protein TabA